MCPRGRWRISSSGKKPEKDDSQHREPPHNDLTRDHSATVRSGSKGAVVAQDEILSFRER